MQGMASMRAGPPSALASMRAGPPLALASMRAGPPSASLAQAPDEAEVPKIFTECSNCGKHVLTSNLQLHEAHCSRNCCRCQHCGEAVVRSELEEHRREQTRDLPQLLNALARGDAAQVRTMLAHGEGVVSSWWRLQVEECRLGTGAAVLPWPLGLASLVQCRS